MNGVLIQIRAGVGDWTQTSGVKVTLLDWDILKDESVDEILLYMDDVEDLPDSTPGKSEAITELNNLIAEIKEYGFE